MDKDLLVTEGRKLVTVREVCGIFPIEGADFIETIQVDGWFLVAKKGEFVLGDPCVFFEIDSLLPLEDPRFSFLDKGSKNKYKVEEKEYARLKTMKMKGQISQGLALPLSYFPEIETQEEVVGYENVVGVLKYERPESGEGSFRGAPVAGNFPVCIPKTDESRIENEYNRLSKMPEVEYAASLKLDGSSITIAYLNDPENFVVKLEEDYPYNYQDAQLVVCSRNLALKHDTESAFWKGVYNTQLHYKLVDYCRENNCSLAIQGELMGEGIQKNREGLKDYDIFVFRVWDINNQCFFDHQEFMDFCQRLGIQTVPQLGVIKPFEKCGSLQEIKKASEIPSLNHKIGEGIVLKSINKIKGATIHWKSINNQFLMKCED